MKKKSLTFNKALLFFIALSASSFITNAATDETSSSVIASPVITPNPAGLTPKELEFAEKAALGGIFEVELGKIAQTNASSPEVKRFALLMMVDHEKDNAELRALAAKKGVSLPTSLDTPHQMMVTKLSKLEGKSFDQLYVIEMVKDHEKDLVAFKEMAATSNDPDLKIFAEKTSTAVGDHLMKIKNIQSQMQ